MANAPKTLVVLVSSPVYGIEELLDRIYTLLTSFHYEVWMSHKGTVPVLPTNHTFENCLDAVRRCDLFLGLITPSYGTGKEDAESLSITHLELREAIKLNKPRWILAHDHVIFARSLLDKLGFHNQQERGELELEKSKVFEDLRVIDMYEEATLLNTPMGDRKGNWVQKFGSDGDASLFVTAQFSRYQEVEAFLKENLRDIEKVASDIQRREE